eukprot:1141934-Pelagomonas_calceolata.AAC.1
MSGATQFESTQGAPGNAGSRSLQGPSPLCHTAALALLSAAIPLSTHGLGAGTTLGSINTIATVQPCLRFHIVHWGAHPLGARAAKPYTARAAMVHTASTANVLAARAAMVHTACTANMLTARAAMVHTACAANVHLSLKHYITSQAISMHARRLGGGCGAAPHRTGVVQHNSALCTEMGLHSNAAAQQWRFTCAEMHSCGRTVWAGVAALRPQRNR